MPTSIEDLLRLHAHILTNNRSASPQSGSDSSTTTRVNIPSTQEVLQKILATFLEKNSPDSTTTQTLLKLLTQIKDLKIVDLSTQANDEIQKLGLFHLKEGTSDEIAQALLKSNTQDREIKYSGDLKRAKDAVLENVVKNIQSTVSHIETLKTTREPAQTTSPSTKVPLKLLTELIKNLIPQGIQVNEDSVRFMIANHIERFTESSKSPRLDLLKASGNPLDPLLIIIESALKAVEKSPQSAESDKLKKLLSELQKNLTNLVTAAAPDSEIREVLKSALKDLGSFKEQTGVGTPITKFADLIHGQISILLASDELNLGGSIDFKTSSELFQIFTKDLHTSLFNLLSETSENIEIHSAAQKAVQLVTKLIDGKLGKDEAGELRQTLATLKSKLSVPPDITSLRTEIAYHELTFITDLFDNASPESLVSHFKTLPSTTSEFLSPERRLELNMRLSTSNTSDRRAIFEELRSEFAKLIEIRPQNLNEKASNTAVQTVIKTLIIELLKEPLLQTIREDTQANPNSTLLDTVIKNIDETKALLLKLAGGKEDPQLRKVLDILTNARDGDRSVQQLKSALEEALDLLPKEIQQKFEKLPQKSGTIAPEALTKLTSAQSGAVLSKNELSLLRTAEQMMHTEQVLRQINPLMESVGQPIFILFPAFIRGFLTPTQVSLFKLPNKEATTSRKESGEAPNAQYSCAAFKITLPKLGELLCYIALREEEIHVAVGSQHAHVVTYLDSKLSLLRTALTAAGYSKIQCETHLTSERSIIPAWISQLNDPARAVA